MGVGYGNETRWGNEEGDDMLPRGEHVANVPDSDPTGSYTKEIYWNSSL